MPTPTFNKYKSTTIYGNLSVTDLTNSSGSSVIEVASVDLSGNFLSRGDSTFTKAVVCNANVGDITANNILTTKEYVDTAVSTGGAVSLTEDNTFTGQNIYSNNVFCNSILDVRPSQSIPSAFRVAIGDVDNPTLPTASAQQFKQIGGLSISQATPVGTPQTATTNYDTDTSIITSYTIPVDFTKNITFLTPIGIRNTGTAVLSGTASSFTITNLFNSFEAKVYVNGVLITTITGGDIVIRNSNSNTRSSTISYTSTGTKSITLNQFFFNLDINLSAYFDNDYFVRNNGITNTLTIILKANITNTLARVSNTGNFTATINTALIANTTTSTFSASLGTNGTATYSPNSNGTDYAVASFTSDYLSLFTTTGTTYSNYLRINKLWCNFDADIEGITTFSDNVNINGTTTINGNADITGTTTINGNAVITGTTTTDNLTINTSFNLLPAGMIVPYTGTTAPTGWLLCQGATLNASVNTQYQPLFNVIGIQFGGTNNTNFKLPDYRGAFLRGNGSQAGGSTYVSSSLNTSQNHATQTHTHASTQSNHSHGLSAVQDILKFGRASSDRVVNFGSNCGGIFPGGTDGATANITISDSTTTGTRYTDANETRPFSYSVNYLIKY